MATEIYRRFGELLGGLSELGKERAIELDGLLAGGKMETIPVLDKYPVADLAKIPVEEMPKVIPELVYEDYIMIDKLGALGRTTAEAFHEIEKLVCSNRLMIGVALIGVGVIGYYVWKQNEEIKNLKTAMVNLTLANQVLANNVVWKGEDKE